MKTTQTINDTENKMLKVWAFEDAPAEYQALSRHGGDEDWVLYIPAGYNKWIGWAEDGSAFGCCSVTEHDLPNGAKIRVGAHA